VTPSPRSPAAQGRAPADLLKAPNADALFGRFQILVLSDPSEAAEYVAHGSPDENGIHWYVGEAERGPNAGIPTALATKLYGGDVVLDWFRGDDLTEPDVRWEQLDRVLTDFVAA
jgi:hypothetical protein